jgi:uncharacterized protein YcbK (DUF882 family)
MWKTFKTFFSKFFSTDLAPVEPSLTPSIVSIAVEHVDVVEEPPKNLGRELEQDLTDNFKLSEFRCNDENRTKVPKKFLKNIAKLAKNLQVLRDEIGKPIKINSAYRTPEYNKKVGGVKTSQHVQAKAADIHVKGMGPKKVAEKVKALIKEGKMDKGGVGIYKNFVHYDIRGVNRRWYGSGVKK